MAGLQPLTPAKAAAYAVALRRLGVSDGWRRAAAVNGHGTPAGGVYYLLRQFGDGGRVTAAIVNRVGADYRIDCFLRHESDAAGCGRALLGYMPSLGEALAVAAAHCAQAGDAPAAL